MKLWLLVLLALASGVAAEPLCSPSKPTPIASGTYGTPRTPQVVRAWQLGRQFDRVLIVVLENMDYGNSIAQPYFKELAARGTLLTRYSGNFHPSYPNYLALVGGKYFGTVGNRQRNLPREERSIADLLEGRGYTWRQYAEGYRGGCDRSNEAAHGRYRRKHVPFLSFDSVALDPARCARVVPAERFDSRKLPNYALYTPDLCHDGHDACDGGTRLGQAARWLQGFLAPLLANPILMEKTLIVVTFDESQSLADNHVYTVLLGGMVRPGVEIADCLDHFNLLRTIEDNFGLGTLDGEDARSSPIIDAFRTAGT